MYGEPVLIFLYLSDFFPIPKRHGYLPVYLIAGLFNEIDVIVKTSTKDDRNMLLKILD